MIDPPIRDAASVVLIRDAGRETARVLMGQRGKTAAFMPNRFVFPGGAVDDEDALVDLGQTASGQCLRRLERFISDGSPEAILAAAIRETWEETGLILGRALPGSAAVAPADPLSDGSWGDFYKRGYAPSAAGMRFFFRAITPPGRPRRFDARFFLVDAAEIQGDLDDFSRASDELSKLHWVEISKARTLDLPFITEVVLAEVEMLSKTSSPPQSVPFFKNDETKSQFIRIA